MITEEEEKLGEGEMQSTEKKVITRVLGLPRHWCTYHTNTERCWCIAISDEQSGEMK